MRSFQRAALASASVVLLLALPGQQADVHGQVTTGLGARMEVWAPMPEKANPFAPPHKPVTKISDLLAKHKGDIRERDADAGSVNRGSEVSGGIDLGSLVSGSIISGRGFDCLPGDSPSGVGDFS